MTNFILMINIFRAIYYQTVLGYSPYMAGTITFFSSLPLLFAAPIGGFLSDRFGPRIPLAIGYTLLIFSFCWLGFFPTPTLSLLFTALLAFSMGAPLIFTPSYSSAMKALPVEKFGIGFGMVSTLRTLAGTIGIALIGLFMHVVKMRHLQNNDSLRDSEIASFSAIHFALAIVMIVAFIFTFIFYQRKSSHCLPESPAEGWD
jgi:MFS family permease